MAGGTTLTVRIVLVRHGESTFNLDKRIQGRTDESLLTERGRQQAICVQTILAEMEFRLAYTSPLQRAYDTAVQITATSSTPLISSPLLQEINLSAWAGMTFAEVETTYPEDYRCWRETPDQVVMSGRYPVQDLWQQAREFWAFLGQEHPDCLEPQPSDDVSTFLLVGHSGINRALISTALGIQPRHYQRIGQDNCCISVLNFQKGLNHPPQLESLNLTAHLGAPLPKSKGGLRLLLVRHGETQWNREQRFQGKRDIPLNEKGEDQAQQVAAFLASQPLDIAFSSPLKRSWATAEAICSYQTNGQAAHPNLDLKPIPELQEICHGLWEGKLQSEIEAEFVGQLAAWQTTPETVQMPDGENLVQVWDRTRQGWIRVLDTMETLGADVIGLVVAHDAINKAAICQVFDLDPASFWCFKQGNGALTVIDYPEGKAGHPVLRAMNITSHMEGGILDCTAAGAL